jgi:hypothetical protein
MTAEEKLLTSAILIVERTTHTIDDGSQVCISSFSRAK